MPEDGPAALAAAAAAQPGWARHAPRERGEILRAPFEPIMDRLDDLALLMTLEMGKPLAESRAEISYAAEFFRWFAEEAVRIEGGYAVDPERRRPVPDHAPAGRAVPADHAVELPDWRWAPARSARRSRRAARWSSSRPRRRPLSMLALAGILRRGRAARRRAQRASPPRAPGR